MILLYLLSFLPLPALSSLLNLVVLPINRKDQAACAHTDRILSSMVEVVEVKRYGSDFLHITQFWSVKADSSNLQTIRNVPGVRGINRISRALPLTFPKVLDAVENTDIVRNCGSPSLGREFGESRESRVIPVVESPETSNLTTLAITPLPRRTILQQGAPQDLDLVSWPAGKPLPSKLKGYAYDVFHGVKTYIYVIGSGLNLDHRVS